MVLAMVLWCSPNHSAATFVVAVITIGWAHAEMHCPVKTIANLYCMGTRESPLSRRRTAPMEFAHDARMIWKKEKNDFQGELRAWKNLIYPLLCHLGRNIVNLEFWFHHLFCCIFARSWLASSKWWRRPEYPVKTTAKPQVTGNFVTCPGQDLNSGSGEGQLVVIGNVFDHMAIRAGPQILCSAPSQIEYSHLAHAPETWGCLVYFSITLNGTLQVILQFSFFLANMITIRANRECRDLARI